MDSWQGGNIVCAVDLGSHSRQVVGWAALRYRAALVVIGRGSSAGVFGRPVVSV